KAKRPTKISQSSGPIPLVADETVIKEWEDRMERAATTASSLEAEHDSESQIRFEATSKQSNDPPLSRVNTLRSREDNMKLKELMEFCTKLSEKALDLYALTVNPTIYTSCIKQFWVTAKVQTVNEEVQIQALVDGKKNWKEWVLRQLPRMNSVALWPLLSSVLPQIKYLTFPMFLDKQVEGMSKHKEIYVTPSHTKKIFANMKREGKGFSGRVTPLFQTMMVQAPEEVGEGSAVPTDSHHTTTQPSTSRPQKKQSRRKQRKDSGPTEPVTDEAINEEHVSTPSYDPPQSGEDRMQLNELMDLCAKLSDRVLALENTNTSQAAEIVTLKERVKKLEKKRRSRTYKSRRLYKVGLSRRIESSDDASLGSQEDASKQGRKIADIDQDAEVTLIDETQGRSDDNLMFDISILDEQEVEVEKVVSAADPVTTAGEVVTTVSVEIPEELTLAQNLIEIKSAKHKASTTASTTTTITRPKARGVVV
ncbi:hypothetical protein Tco_0846171, partial [Tanacetum coccineum]